MEELWCWRCRMEVPMLDEEEYRLVREARRDGMEAVERERRGIAAPSPLTLHSPHAESERPTLEMYRLLTGFEETNPNAVWHHRISMYGPPCPSCEKPLRTSAARYCAACGYGMEEMKDDGRPLVERRPEEFSVDG